MKRTYFKERIFVPLVLLMVLAAITLSFISCMPDLPGEEDTVVIPPAPDPLPGEEEPEQPKAWVWHLTPARSPCHFRFLKTKAACRFSSMEGDRKCSQTETSTLFSPKG